MIQQTSRVIRSDEVKIAGRRQIGCATAGVSPDSAGPTGPTARLVAEDDAGATIEVVCECGKRVYLRCAYHGAGAARAGQPAETPPIEETAQ